MSAKVTIVDYGLGNLFSVSRAFEVCGAEVVLAAEPDGIEHAERLVLPGVGAFADGMQGLAQRGMVEPLRRYAESGRPLLGICLGMQLLLSVSEEFGLHEGLDLIPGRVVPIPAEDAAGRRRIPHIGWSALVPSAGRSWTSTPLEDVAPGTAMYFVHSFTAAPADPGHRLADCDHDGFTVCAAVQKGNIVGCQFHPERSGNDGLRIVRRFISPF